jgi:parallel beta-helix repeat protein
MPVRIQSATYWFPRDFLGQTLDHAIHNETVLEGDTIIVQGGTYSEHLNINKSINLQGGNQGVTILDGGGNGTVVDISVGNVIFNYFTVRNGLNGICIKGTNTSVVSNTILTNNVIMSNIYGIYILDSANNVLKNNTLTGNSYNFGVEGSELQDFIQNINTSNTVDGRPICYWVNKTGEPIPRDAGYVAVVNSTDVDIENLTIRNNRHGILLAYTTNSAVGNNSLSNNEAGIRLFASEHNEVMNNSLTYNLVGLYLRYSDNNTILCNDIAKNGVGLNLWYSNNNTLYRNNLVTNNQPSSRTESSNTFDNGREGNYWDDYVPSGQGKDVDGDGIGDTWVYGGTVVPTNTTPYYGVDYRPLMEPWQVNRTFGVIRYGHYYNFITLSNSTVAKVSVNWNRDLRIIGFNLTSGTTESINVTIPRNWLDGPFEIKLNETNLGSSSFSVNQNYMYSYIFLRYNPGTYMVKIMGAKVLGYWSGDINGDGIVDLFDAIILAGHFNTSD